MKRKSFLTKTALTLLAALFTLTGARADELTVFTQSSNATNQYVPAYMSGLSSTSGGFNSTTTYYYTKSQYIIPSTTSGMSTMSGKIITGIKFYTNSSTRYTSPSVNICLQEVTSNKFSNTTFMTGGTVVYEGALGNLKSGNSNNAGTITIAFSTPFPYSGGHLLISIENTETGSAPSGNSNISFKGQNNQSNAACYGRGQNNVPATGTRANFIPQTTFTYFSAPLDITASSITNNKATISWDGDANATYTLKYRQEEGTTTTTDFENHSLTDSNNKTWKAIDTDGDNLGWVAYSTNTTYSSYAPGADGHDSNDMIVSGSFCSNSNNSSYSNRALIPDNYLVSPQVTLGGSISFWAKGLDPSAAEETFGVAVYETTSTTQPTSSANFTMVGPHKVATGEWTQYVFDLSNYSNKGYVAIRHYGVSNMDLLCVDDIVITEPSSTSGWTEQSVTGNSYILNGLSQEKGYQVVVTSTDGRQVGTRFTTTGLNPVPTDISVTNIGGQEATINWFGISDSYKVQYSANPVSGPEFFFEDFENGLGQFTAIKGRNATVPSGYDNGWSSTQVNDTQFKFSAVSGEKAAGSLSWYNSQTYTANNWLITPKVTFRNNVKFWVRTSPGYPDKYKVVIYPTNKTSISASDTASFTVLQNLDYAPKVFKWTQVSIDISAYDGQEGYIAIVHSWRNGNYLLIDDFGIYGEDVEGDAGWTTVTASELSKKLTGLTPGTEYQYRVGVNDGENDIYSPIGTFTTLDEKDVSLANKADNTRLIKILDGKSGYNVTLEGRTISKNGNWNTLCLPFDVELTGEFADADVRTLDTDATVLANDNLSIKFAPVSTTTLSAGTPYLIRWTSGNDISDPVFENVTVTKEMHEVTCDLVGDWSITFKGNYDYLTFSAPDKSILYISKNKFYYPGANAKIGAQRAYFKLNGFTLDDSSSSSIKVLLDFSEDDATGIESIDNGQWTIDNEIYNVAGQRLSKMQKGINIVNGKKIIK